LRLSPVGPATRTYSLTNSGTASLDWTLAYSVSWLDASATDGTLAPGGPTVEVAVNPNAAANSLPLGNYSADVWFTNLNDSSVQSRRYTLTVQPTPQTAAITRVSWRIGKLCQWESPLACWLRNSLTHLMPASNRLRFLERFVRHDLLDLPIAAKPDAGGWKPTEAPHQTGSGE
jgi:hypothetical protein